MTNKTKLFDSVLGVKPVTAIVVRGVGDLRAVILKMADSNNQQFKIVTLAMMPGDARRLMEQVKDGSVVEIQPMKGEWI